METTKIVPFASRITDSALSMTEAPQVLQVNLGRLCNLSCTHCHMEAGPQRTECMSEETMDAVLELFEKHGYQTLDITGGAPEMNPHFREFLAKAVTICPEIIVRSNGAILLEEDYADLPAYFAEHGITVFLSLPCYGPENTDRQRGNGVFSQVIQAMRVLNELGYGRQESLSLHLVYNPGGAFLPPSQQGLEADYRIRLQEDHGVVFTNLFTITNNPIGRFRMVLQSTSAYGGYMRLLSDNFNADTLPHLMCRTQLSVGWDGRLYDCDFNQVISLPVQGAETVQELLDTDYAPREIRYADHCYACTAGAGSSCGGAVAENVQ